MKPYVKLSLSMILVVGVAYSTSLILRGDNEKLPVSTWQEGTEDRLITIPVQTSGASPFIDANDTVEIESREKSIIFYSRNGERIYNPATKTWSVSISPNKYQDKAKKPEKHSYDELNSNQLTILGWYVNRRYDSFIICDNPNYFLFSYIDEGSFHIYDELVDAVGKKVWRIPSRMAYYLHINPPFAWMGDNRGIVRMDLKNNRLTRFVLLPTFNDDSQWCDFQGKRYITNSYEKFIQVLDLQSGNISILNFPVEIKNALYNSTYDPFDDLAHPGLAFSNPVVWNGSLYISIFLFYGKNVFIKYHLASGKWWYKILSDPGENSFVEHLVEIKDMLWLLNPVIWTEEPGDEVRYGNFSAVDKNGTTHCFPQLKGILELVSNSGGTDVTYHAARIRAYFGDADNIYFLAMRREYYNTNSQYSPVGTVIKLSGPNWQTVTMEPLCNSNRNPDRDEEYQIRESNLKLYKQFIPVSSRLKADEIQSLKQSWKVRYAMVEIPYGKAKPVDYTKENKRSLNQEEEPGDKEQ